MEEIFSSTDDAASTEETLSVSAAMARAKGALESFTLTLLGEVSELNNKPGYKAVYFTVKDEHASLPCMMWLNRYQAAGITMHVGMLVELTGRFTLYAPKGRMNFDVFSFSLAGEGNLRLKVANLAKKLQAEGLMRPERKRSLPPFPQKIGLVTSPRGAAVHDVLRTLRRRFALAQVLVAGVPVEGEGAAEGLIEGLHAVEAAGADVVLLVRGGGSFEDLMPFNDEALARAIADLEIPVVTGIGHEPDTSIADMVADLRASTPTAAAEAVSPAPEALDSLLTSNSLRIHASLNRRLDYESAAINLVGARPIFQDPNMLFALESQTVDILEDRLRRAIPLNIERDRLKLEHAGDRLRSSGGALLPRFQTEISLKASRLHDLSPLIILSRGYSVTRNEKGDVLKSVASVKRGDGLTVDLSDGSLFCRVEDIEEIAVVNWEEHNG